MTARPAVPAAGQPAPPAHLPTRMSTWRLEWLRLVRTPRALAISAVYIVFGLVEPVAAKYLSQIVNHAGGARNVKISIPPPTPPDGISAYVSEVSTVGLIVVVVIAAGAFNFDGRQGLATFLRTRAASIWQLLTPRFTLNAAAAVAAYLLGTLAAWYETNLLIGSLPAGPMIEGVLCGACYLAFAVALTALATSLVKNTLGAVGLTAVLLLALPIAASYHRIQYWLPSSLVNAPIDLLTGTHLTRYLPAIGVAVSASVLLLIASATRMRAREV